MYVPVLNLMFFLHFIIKCIAEWHVRSSFSKTCYLQQIVSSCMRIFFHAMANDCQESSLVCLFLYLSPQTFSVVTLFLNLPNTIYLLKLLIVMHEMSGTGITRLNTIWTVNNSFRVKIIFPVKISFSVKIRYPVKIIFPVKTSATNRHS